MTNAWPHECVELFNLCCRGQFEPARALYTIMIDAFHLDTHVKLVQYIKLAEHLTYDASEHLRAPRLILTGAERERVAAIIERTKAELARRKRVA
jgi:4-hydroxy-tetrahydrodipicolinate synthase